MNLQPAVDLTATHLSSKTKISPEMSMLALRGPALFPPPNDMLWDGGRSLDSFRRQSPHEQIELPSIRQAVPEIDIRATRPDLDRRRGARTCSPRSATAPLSLMDQHSNKRRRLSVQEENDPELREYIGTRSCRSPTQSAHRSQSLALSPTFSSRRTSGFSLDSSYSSTRSSPSMPSRALPAESPSRPFNTTSISRSNWRPTLPSLPALVPEQTPTIARRRSNSSWSDGAGPRPLSQPIHVPKSSFKPAISYNHPTYPYEQAHGHPGLYSSLYERQPFNFSQQTGYTGPFAYGIQASDANDNKQRKRRGNLPKETTDKLRTWFVGHLQHPYPTEDEKQELMKQTGLQMNQISNWFINARRRQLPAMITNAQAESGARQVRSVSAGRLFKGDSASESGDDVEGKEGGPVRLRGVSEGHVGAECDEGFGS